MDWPTRPGAPRSRRRAGLLTFALEGETQQPRSARGSEAHAIGLPGANRFVAEGKLLTTNPEKEWRHLMTLNLSLPQDPFDIRPKITVVGVGGAGGNAVNNMIRSKLEGVEFLVANTDAQALQQSPVRAAHPARLDRDQGTGRGRAARRRPHGRRGGGARHRRAAGRLQHGVHHRRHGRRHRHRRRARWSPRSPASRAS